MNYTGELAAIQKFSDSTVIDVNFNDSDNEIPNQRLSIEIKNINPTQEEISTAISDAADRLKNEYIEIQNNILPDPYSLMQSILDGNITPGTYDAIRDSLYELSAESIELGSFEMSVSPKTAEQQEDFDNKLKEKVEAKLGPGTYSIIKFVLKQMGFKQVVAWRKSLIDLN